MKTILIQFAILTACTLPATSLTIHVPMDAESIQAGIDLAEAGDTVEVACGVYEEFHLEMKSGIVLRSSTGDPDCVTVDAMEKGYCISGVDLDGSTVIEGITFTKADEFHGGAGRFTDSALSILSCVIYDNRSESQGGGIYFKESRPRIVDTLFKNNIAGEGTGGSAICFDEYSHVDIQGCRFIENGHHQQGCWGTIAVTNGSCGRIGGSYFEGNRTIKGGGIAVHDAYRLLIEDCIFYDNYGWAGGHAVSLNKCRGVFSGCTFVANDGYIGSTVNLELGSYEVESCSFVGNIASGGGNLGLAEDAYVSIDKCLIAESIQGQAVYQDWLDDPPQITCSNFFGNPAGDWTSVIWELLGVDGNISEDPLFCTSLDYRSFLQPESPCLPDNNDCGLMGAWGACGSLTRDGFRACASPNPFNPNTRIEFTLEQSSHALVELFDISGRRIAVLMDERVAPGRQVLEWTGADQLGGPQSSGVYFCRIQAGEAEEILKLILLK